jgi:hypothetical protein
VKVFEELAGDSLPADSVCEPRVVCFRTDRRLRSRDIARLLSPTWQAAEENERELALEKLHDTIQKEFRDDNIVTVVNGAQARGPDVFFAGAGWYLGVQCKMYPTTKLSDADATADIDKMTLPSTHSLKQKLLVIVAGAPQERVDQSLLDRCDFIHLGASTEEACHRLEPLGLLVDTAEPDTLTRSMGQKVVTPEVPDSVPREPHDDVDENPETAA